MSNLLEKKIKFKNITVLIFVLPLAVWGCFQEEWTGFVYPDKNNLQVHREIGTYSSLEQCRDVAHDTIHNAKWNNADYECGLNCDRSSLPMICEKTER